MAATARESRLPEGVVTVGVLEVAVERVLLEIGDVFSGFLTSMTPSGRPLSGSHTT